MVEKTQNIEPCKMSWRSSPLAGLVFASIGGLIGWILIQSFHPVFHVPTKYDIANLGAPQEKFDALQIVQNQVNRENAMLDLALLGGLISASLALRSVDTRRCWVSLVIATLLGVLFGRLAGWAGSLAHEYFIPLSVAPTLLDTVKVQAILLAPLGAGVGLGSGASRRSIRAAGTGLLTGFLVGGLAAVLYPAVVSILVPSATTEPLIPAEGVSRLLWIELNAGLLGLTIPAFVQPGIKPTPLPIEAQ